MSDPRDGTHLDRTIAAALAKRRAHATLRQLTTNGPHCVDFSSNDFLSLATSPQLRQVFFQELTTGPVATNLGSGGSRLLDGNSTYAERLERDIAAFHHAPAALLCNSGFDANVGLFSCLPQPGDVVVYDDFIHASVHDGMRLSRARECVAFAHNSVDALRGVLEQLLDEDDDDDDEAGVGRGNALRHGRANCFVAVEAVYSMDGDVAPLAAIVTLLDELLPHGNGHLIVDEAHSTGVFGARGRGLVCELGLEARVAVRLHTFGKALACTGAVLLCRPLLRQYLLNYARPIIYTTFLSYPALAAVRASYRFLIEGRTEALAQNLRTLIAALHVRLLDVQAAVGIPSVLEHLLRCPRACPPSPIFAVLTSEPKILAAHCQRAGFVVRGIVWPTVPAGSERIRICLHAGNTIQQVDALVAVIRGWVEGRIRELGSADALKARL